MAHCNTILSQILKLVPRHEFETLAVPRPKPEYIVRPAARKAVIATIRNGVISVSSPHGQPLNSHLLSSSPELLIQLF